MSKNPAELKYAATHEWARANDDGSVTVGITDHAQAQLGDLVFVEVPEVGQKVSATEPCAVVESVKAASDIYSPAAGEVVAVNTALNDTPELINQDPYGDGWIFRLQLTGPLDNLLNADAYEALVMDEE